MADRFVTVGEFPSSVEAHLARNALEAEGVRAFLSGNEAAGLFGGNSTFAVKLQVREDEAARAAGILAACLAKVQDVDDEASEPVWLCPLCGEPVRVRHDVCRACQTPRGAIQAVEPGSYLPSPSKPRRREPSPPPSQDLTPDAPPPPEPEPKPEPVGVELPPAADLLQGDDLARRAFRSALFGFFFPPLFLYSAWLLVRLFNYPAELSPAATRRLHGALVVLLVLVVVWAPVLILLGVALTRILLH
jgi:hypothetical protein